MESPLAVEAVLGETSFSVTDEKVSILELRVHAISSLALVLQPSPGNSHTMVAKATGLQTLTAPKQVRVHPGTLIRMNGCNKGLAGVTLDDQYWHDTAYVRRPSYKLTQTHYFVISINT